MKANKKLGQHFLICEQTIQSICQDFREESDILIEVGPGTGQLTKELVKNGHPLYLVEKDQRFITPLSQVVPSKNIYHEDALQFDWPKFLKSLGSVEQKIWLVSNLPYNVSAPLLILFIQQRLLYMTLMFQKEVGEKVLPQYQGKKTLKINSLYCLVWAYFDVQLNCLVGPKCFDPPPKVDSIVLSFTKKEQSLLPLEHFSAYEAFLRKLFGQRRKQLQKLLKGHYNEELVHDIFTRLKISLTLRAEDLTLEEVISLFTAFERT